MAGTSRTVRSAISCFISHTRSVDTLTTKHAFIPARYISVSSRRNMKFVQFSYNDMPTDLRVGYVEGDKVVDLSKVDSSLSPTLLGILRNGQVDKVQRLKATNPAAVPLSSVTLAAPITDVDKVLCVGLNYKDHCQEQNLTPPTVPMIFSKFASTIIGPNDAVRLRTETTKFLRCEDPEQIHIGYMAGSEDLVDINAEDLRLPLSMIEMLRDPVALAKIKKIPARNPKKIPLRYCSLAPPIHGMDKVIGIEVNYKDFCVTHNHPFPHVPVFFGKFASTVIGPDGAVRIRTRFVEKVDFEVELTVVIGRPTSNVAADQALSYVFGYTIAQDISARDWQKEKNGGQFLLGKSMDTFCPIGPWIVTADEVGDPHQLNIRCSLNGKLMQDSNTCQLINSIPTIIERLSSVMTLLPGDIILTGTPGGVGMYRKPPVYLCPGDVLVSEVDKLGSLSTRVEQF